MAASNVVFKYKNIHCMLKPIFFVEKKILKIEQNLNWLKILVDLEEKNRQLKEEIKRLMTETDMFRTALSSHLCVSPTEPDPTAEPLPRAQDTASHWPQWLHVNLLHVFLSFHFIISSFKCNIKIHIQKYFDI